MIISGEKIGSLSEEVPYSQINTMAPESQHTQKTIENHLNYHWVLCVNCAIHIILSHCKIKMENPEWITRYFFCVWEIKIKTERRILYRVINKSLSLIEIAFDLFQFHFDPVWCVCDWSELRDFNRLIVCGSQQVKSVIHFLWLLCLVDCNMFINTGFQYCGKCLRQHKNYIKS